MFFFPEKKVIYTCKLKLCFIPNHLQTPVSKMTIVPICTIAQRLTILSICWWNTLLGTVVKITLWTSCIIPNEIHINMHLTITTLDSYIFSIIIIFFSNQNYLLSHCLVWIFKKYPEQHSMPPFLKSIGRYFKHWYMYPTL